MKKDTIYDYCPNVKCSSLCQKVDHKIESIGVRAEGFTAIGYHLTCSVCGYKHHLEIPRTKGKRQQYPYHNESVDVTFTDKHHEKQYIRENKLEAL